MTAPSVARGNMTTAAKDTASGEDTVLQCLPKLWTPAMLK
jgi:hypothetical protein